MSTVTDAPLPLLRLMHLVSPSLPIGAFTYSQGIEWAVECGWIDGPDDLAAWIEDQLQDGLGQLDIPILQRCYAACQTHDAASLAYWSDLLLAHRESAELRAEERQRGRALSDLLVSLEFPLAAQWSHTLHKTQIAGFALAAGHWQLSCEQAALGHAWAWLENLIMAAVKIIPLGQTAGQRLLLELTPLLPEVVERGLQMNDDDIGSSLPALAIASARHETQYTRLFRS